MAWNQKNPKENTVFSWILTIVMLSAAWPIGLFLLFRMLTVGSITSPRKPGRGQPIDVTAREVREPQLPQKQTAVQKTAPARSRAAAAPVRKTVPIKKKWGRGLIIAGGITTGCFALILASQLADIAAYGWYSYMAQELVFLTGCLAAGVTLLVCGIGRRKKASRYRRYLAMIGSREMLSIDTLAKAVNLPYRRVCSDLQNMLDRNFLPAGYIDALNRRLVLSESGIQEPPPAPVPEEKKDAPEGGDEAILAEIRRINDDIADEAMSRKIDRIEEITAKILDYQKKNPDTASELRSFLNYYLPTTLKILRSYAQMEAQGIEGKNITSTKERIEGMMDKVVDGFETRLDQLFHSDAVDISSDVQVLEQMLQKDGLSSADPLKIEL